MTSSVTIDVGTFARRLEKVRSQWKEEGPLNGCDVMMVGLGEPSEMTVYQKSTALFTWMLGYEFPETVMAITPTSVSFLTSVRKAAILKQLSEGGENVQVFGREKEKGSAGPVFDEFWAAIGGGKDSVVRVGQCVKDRLEGSLYAEWAAYFEARPDKTVTDIAPSVSTLLASKDESEMASVVIAAKTCGVLMEECLAGRVLAAVDEGKRVTHAQLSEAIEGQVSDQLGRYKSKLPADISLDNVDLCYPPIIQSGGIFSLKPSAVSNEERLHPSGAILCSLGIRYKSYCTNLSRTLLVNPTKVQEEELEFLMELQKHLVSLMKPGVGLADIYHASVEYTQANRPDAVGHLPANVGFSMGLEFREPDWVLNAKSTRVIQPGMVFNLVVGLQGLTLDSSKDPKEQSYALLLADTVSVGEAGAKMLTGGCLGGLEQVSYSMKQRKAAIIPSVGGAIKRTRLRNLQPDQEAEKRRKEHQKALLTASTKEALSRYAGSGQKKTEQDQKAAIKQFESYKKETALPKDLSPSEWRIYVDRRAESLILPIQGFAVPFHIATVKNVTKNDEGDFVTLRINFNTPGRTFGKKDATPAFEDPRAEFIRGVVFRSADAQRVQETFKEIQELRKAYAEREAAKKERSDLVAQAELAEIVGRRPARLVDVYCRPTLESRRAPGDVEIHQNGLRFKTQLKADQRLDILFSNIKHFFFQPCDTESVVILHAHLHHPIMVGKRKTKDIQFYREAIDSLVDETSGRRTRMRFGDEDELAQEAEERKRRAEANAEFKAFAERITEAARSTRLDVDVPFRDLAFSGIFTKHNTLLQPTTDCLVQLTEPPFLVVTLAEVEIAYLERVMFGLKNFDLVFVLKDHDKPVVPINSIPIASLEAVKDWLDSVDVPFAESKINFNWPNVLKTIKEDPVDFYENGGWASLQPDENGDDSDDEEDLSSAYEPDEEDEEEFAESGSDDGEDDEEEESEFEDSEDEESDEEDGSEDGSEEEESDAPDWDELERRAAKEDARRESAAGSKRKAPPAPSRSQKRR